MHLSFLGSFFPNILHVKLCNRNLRPKPQLKPPRTVPPPAECKQDVYLPYALELLAQDKFDDARIAYLKGGRPDLSTRLLERLAANAVTENRFDDASYYFYQLAMEAMEVCVPAWSQRYLVSAVTMQL